MKSSQKKYTLITKEQIENLISYKKGILSIGCLMSKFHISSYAAEEMLERLQELKIIDANGRAIKDRIWSVDSIQVAYVPKNTIPEKAKPSKAKRNIQTKNRRKSPKKDDIPGQLSFFQ